MTNACQQNSSLPFDQIIQTLTEGVVIEDTAGYIVIANHALEQLLGYGSGELAGLHWTTLVPEESQEQARAQRNGGRGRSATGYESELQRKDGTRIWASVNIRSLYEFDRQRGVLSVIAPRGRCGQGPIGQPEFSRIEARRIETRMPLPAEAAALGQHLSSVVHELNNPLTIILLQTQVLNRAAPETPQFQSGLATIQDQAQRMRRMVQGLLAYVGPPSNQWEMTDINKLVQHTLEQQRPIQADDIQLITDLAGDLPTTQADPDRLQQVFVNILSNAQQALLSKNGSTGPVAGQQGQVRVTTALIRDDQGCEPCIQVRFVDNGPGIPPEVMPHLFEPFFTTKKAGEGTGLGLSICQRIVREHKGHIWAENNEEGGATFVLDLPVVAYLGQGKPAQDDRAWMEQSRAVGPYFVNGGDRLEKMQTMEIRRRSSEFPQAAVV